MPVNTRLVDSVSNAGAAVVPPSTAAGAPKAAQAVALTDGSGNLLKAIDNADGTATLAADVRSVGVAVTGSATGAAAAAVSASLPAVAAKTNYLTGFVVTATNPAAVVNGVVTVTGLVSGTLSFQFVEAVATGGQLVVTFDTPIPASAVNTAITANLPAITGGGAGAVAVFGYVA